MPDLHACVTAVDYAYPWSELVARFKFRDAPGWASLFSRLILREPAARELLTQCDVLVPIPITPQRLGERGYNQAWELIKALRLQAAASGAPAAPGLSDALVRRGESPDQHSLRREQRLKNLRGAFVVPPDHTHQLQQAHVLLVDDVTTTGATLQTAALAMRKAGAMRVSALVFARTPNAAFSAGA